MAVHNLKGSIALQQVKGLLVTQTVAGSILRRGFIGQYIDEPPHVVRVSAPIPEGEKRFVGRLGVSR